MIKVVVAFLCLLGAFASVEYAVYAHFYPAKHEPAEDPQQLTARYVREHGCKVSFEFAGGNEFDESLGHTRWRHGYKAYQCVGIVGGIIIRDNEVQP